MKKHLLFLLSLLLTAVSSNATISGDWKLYATFDNFVEKVIDTPEQTYMLALGQPYDSSQSTLAKKYPFLFIYDKETDELLPCTSRDLLSENIVNNIFYNAKKGYLLIIYDNGNIDLLERDGSAHNIPGLMTASVMGSKSVNDATFDTDNDRIYLATDFGFVVINDKKYEIADSRNYNQKFNSFARVGDFYVGATNDGILTARTNERLLSIDGYKTTPVENGSFSIMPLNGNKAIVLLPSDGNTSRVPHSLTINSDGSTGLQALDNESASSSCLNKQGYFISLNSKMLQADMDGNVTSANMPSSMKGEKSGSWDFKEFWYGVPRKGLTSYKYADNTWKMTRDYISPNSPSTFFCSDMEYSSKYGLLTVIHVSTDYIFTAARKQQLLISGLKDGGWNEYSPIYTYPQRNYLMFESNGMAIAPENPDIFYVTSRFNGLVRLNMTDPSDILHLSGPNDSDKGKPGFHEVVGTNKAWDLLCHFSEPAFDNAGNLFMLYANGSTETNYKGPIWVWPAESRKAENISGLRSMKHTMQTVAHGSQILPLRHSSNKNLLVLCSGSWDLQAVIVDHKGTLEDDTDDNVITMANIADQDGASVTNNRIFTFYEDQSTGYVWVGSYNGVFYFKPTEVLQNPSKVYRVKVSRNDGTNLADYLLDNITVHEITEDNKGRKWFGTAGGGIVVTSSDGREVLQEFTTDNSYLPGNTIYSMCYNPDTNSMMVSTDAGLCEFFISGTSQGSDNELDALKIYPNPVRPDFLGWVTIEGLASNSLVKIVDASGNLVKELGRVDSGSVQWDVCNYELKRVKTGVYYVAVSASDGDSNFAKMAKILVVN